MVEIGDCYQEILQRNCDWEIPVRERAQMFSTATGHRREQKCDADYRKKNIVPPVCFDQALRDIVAEGADFLVEIGPSGALAGPVK